VGRVGVEVARRKASWSLRLRLHSGLRQSGAHPSRKMPRDEWGTRQYSKIPDMTKRVLYLATLLCVMTILPQSSAQTPLAKNLDVIRKSVVFIYYRDAQGVEQPEGTGFLLAIPLKRDPARSYLVLVTARHIADPAWLCLPAHELIAHFNKKQFDPAKDESGIAELPLSHQQWGFPDDDSVDIAFTILDATAYEALSSENGGLSISQLPSASEAKSVEIGSAVVSAGLLPGVPGAKRNYPIFKFGNVSSIPLEKIPVPGCAGTPRLVTEWLIAASLVGGNSGSPIVRTAPLGETGRPFLLGVQSISFRDQTGEFDVAGMAPIRYLVERLREIPGGNADLSIPGDVEVEVDVKPTTTSAQPQITPTTVPTPH